MATTTSVFVASSFEEFKELRGEIRRLIESFRGLVARDLGMNEPAPHPTLEHSVKALRLCDYLVLLVGESYGTPLPEQGKSHTHLEYLAASKDQIPVIPFAIGEGFRSHHGRQCEDERIVAWLEEIERFQTVSYLDSGEETSQTASYVFKMLLQQVFQDAISSDADDAAFSDMQFEDAEIGVAAHFSPEDLEALSGDTGTTDGLRLREEVERKRSLEEMVASPAATAALEQKREAYAALDIGDRIAAVDHLLKALELRPTDWDANYRLADLLVATRLKSKCAEAVARARRAAQIARVRDLTLHHAGSLMLAARASEGAGDPESALRFGEEARDVAPWFASARVALACQYAERDRVDDAFREAREAFLNRPLSILEFNRQPEFHRIRKPFSAFKHRLRGEVASWVARTIQGEVAVAEALASAYLLSGIGKDLAHKEADEDLRRLGEVPLMQLIEFGRRSGQRQLRMLTSGVSKLSEAESVLEDRRSQVTAIQEKLASRRLQDAERIRMQRGMLEHARGQCEEATRALVPRAAYIVRAALSIVFGITGIGSGVMLVRGLHGLWWPAIPLLVSLFVAPLLFSSGRRKMREAQRTARHLQFAREVLSSEKARLEQIEAEAREAQQAAESEVRDLQGQIDWLNEVLANGWAAFSNGVRLFENGCIRHRILSPGRGLKRAGLNDLIRFDTRNPDRYEDCDLDLALPGGASEGEGTSAPFQILRITSVSGDRRKAARWAVYGDVPPHTAWSATTTGESEGPLTSPLLRPRANAGPGPPVSAGPHGGHG